MNCNVKANIYTITMKIINIQFCKVYASCTLHFINISSMFCIKNGVIEKWKRVNNCCNNWHLKDMQTYSIESLAFVTIMNPNLRHDRSLVRSKMHVFSPFSM